MPMRDGLRAGARRSWSRAPAAPDAHTTRIRRSGDHGVEAWRGYGWRSCVIFQRRRLRAFVKREWAVCCPKDAIWRRRVTAGIPGVGTRRRMNGDSPASGHKYPRIPETGLFLSAQKMKVMICLEDS